MGRCSESILKGYDGLVSIFVLGDWEAKRERIMRLYNLSPEEAEHMMSRKDWERKSYHNYYCKGKWGDSRNYDLSINSSRLGSRARWTSWRPTSAPAWTPNAAQGLA